MRAFYESALNASKSTIGFSLETWDAAIYGAFGTTTGQSEDDGTRVIQAAVTFGSMRMPLNRFWFFHFAHKKVIKINRIRIRNSSPELLYYYYSYTGKIYCGGVGLLIISDHKSFTGEIKECYYTPL